MNIIICKDYDEMSQKACDILVDQVKEKPNAVLGLATGSTPLGLYQKVINAYKHGQLTFKDVTTYNLDEYIGIDIAHPQSYHQYMHHHLFSKTDIDLSKTHLPKNDYHNMHQCAKLYNKQLNKTSIDLQILGIGSNGHIGFNEPGTPFGHEVFIVELDEQTRIDNKRFFSHLDEVPTHAITMGIKNIMRSKHIVLLASGTEKSEAVFKMIKGPVTELLPASILQLHPNVTIIIDEKAASKYLEYEKSLNS